MKQNRCIFCMSETNGQEQVCPVCKKGIWEYQWKEDYLEPYTKLKGRYLVGAASEEQQGEIRYTGYDLLMEQKVLLYVYEAELWDRVKEKEAALLFGKFDFSGITAVKDYFRENGKGYMVTSFAQGDTLEQYLKIHGKISEEQTAKMLLPVVRAINALHASGMVHGKVNPEHLIVTEEGRVCLLADCSGYMEEQDRDRTTEITETDTPAAEVAAADEKAKILYKGKEFRTGNESFCTAPEQTEEDGIPGPWTDLYALGAVWYEMITGHRPESAAQRKKKDTLRKPSKYTEVTQYTERALMQALAPDPQMRFFYLGNFLESMKLSLEGVQQDAGTIRHIWGEAWLEAAGSTKEQRKKRGMKGYLRKRLAAAAIALVCLAGAGTAGMYAYIRTHQPEYFRWKLEQAREKTDVRADQGIFDKENPKYEEVKDFILEYGEAGDDSAEGENASYDFEEEDLEYCPVEHSASSSFYLDYKTVKNAVAYYMDIQEDMDLDSTSFFSSGYIYKDEKERIILNMEKTDIYKIRGLQEEAEFVYDSLDNGLMEVQYTASKERCAHFLETIFPLLAPETYLTEEEVEELLGMISEEGDFKYLNLAARYVLSISHREAYSVKVTPQKPYFSNWYTDYADREDDTQYAGNYERGSSRYEEFTAFVKENAVSEEVSEEDDTSVTIDHLGARIYTLKEKDVLEWGEPCNQYRFFIKADVLVDKLKEMGYQMRKTSERKENTVELQKYGSILTDFRVVEHYQMTEEIYLAIAKDLVNEDVMQMEVYRKEGRDVLLYEAAADVTEATGVNGEFDEAAKKDYADNIKKVEERVNGENTTEFLMIDNVAYIYSDYKNTGTGIAVVHSEYLNGPSYYWR